MTFRPMRSQLEVQHLHDILHDVLSDRELAEDVVPEPLIGPLILVADCLCWLLHHDREDHSHAANFASIVSFLREDLESRGHTWEAGQGGYNIIEED